MNSHADSSFGLQSVVDQFPELPCELNAYVSNPAQLGEKELESEADLDAVLANAGYAVKTADLPHLAQRLEQLEALLVFSQDAEISRLSGDAVHKNPCDLASWVESMMQELAPCVESAQPHGKSGEEFPFGEGSCSIDSQIDQRGSYLADVSGQQQASGSMSSIDDGAVGLTSASCALKDTSTIALLEELEEGFQYRGDDTLDTFSIGLQAVFTEDMNLPHGGTTFLEASRSYSRPEELHRSKFQLRNDTRPTVLSRGVSPLRRVEVMDSPQQVHPGDQFSLYSSCEGQEFGCVTDCGNQCSPIPLDAPSMQEVGQDPGILLVRLLMACAEAVQSDDRAVADELVREIQKLVTVQSGAMAKVASHFANALADRIYGSRSSSGQSPYADSSAEFLYLQFYETCPYLKFAHFTANQAILEAVDGRKVVHVIDLNLMPGLQWPALIQALALRPGGPPRLRLTGIGPPQPDDTDVLHEIGMKLAQLADSVNVEFDFRGVIATKLDDVKPWMLQVQPGEAVAVNSILQLHRLLSRETSVHTAPIDEVLRSVRSLSPQIITVVEQEGNHNSSNFLERFTQALQYYCTMFDSLEACNLPPQSLEVAWTELYLGREIINVIAREGSSRVERHETLSEWRVRMAGAGFRPTQLGSNALKQARMLLTLFPREGHTVQENDGCLTLGWHSRPLIAASAWQCA